MTGDVINWKHTKHGTEETIKDIIGNIFPEFKDTPLPDKSGSPHSGKIKEIRPNCKHSLILKM